MDEKGDGGFFNIAELAEFLKRAEKIVKAEDLKEALDQKPKWAKDFIRDIMSSLVWIDKIYHEVLKVRGEQEMDDKGNRRLFNTEGAAKFLKCSEEDISQLVQEKKIPHSILPFGKILFDPQRLRDWVMSFEQMPHYRKEEKTSEKSHKTSIRKDICQRFNCVARERSKYTNLYLGQKIYAQLHPSVSGDGADLALRECGDDDNLPKCKVLIRTEIGKLNGYWKVNKSWLDGNGRFTDHPAAAFHIPGSLQDNPEHPGWEELKVLLEYTEKKCSKK